MPILPCPMGTDGEDGATWKSVDIAFEQAQVADHVKFAHQNVAAGAAPAQLKAEKLTRPNIKVKDSQIDEEAFWILLTPVDNLQGSGEPYCEH